ncbi:response regulator [Pedobacter sp. SYSU D00535]|uniref:response regulator n=1 Tax=Pedobacter sp. SYSU D00535 TaxID=2810308 RepID=UPI001A97BCEE|nr:response regulator [Pedobacter sp. SYSU D00535]
MKKILVCDDDKDILEIIDFLLSENGWEVVTTTHVDRIIEQVEEAKPCVIIMDNWIPSTGGIIATQTIKSHPQHGNIPVIYSTANNDIESLAARAGADLFISKPFNLDNLEQIVDNAYQLKYG